MTLIQTQANKLIMIAFMNRLKQECLSQYRQFEERNKDKDRLFFFCFPKFEDKMENMIDFPDPSKYLFGFFLTPQDCGSELEVPLSQSTSSYSSKYRREGSDLLGLHKDYDGSLCISSSLRKRINPQYLSITISDFKENESNSFITNIGEKQPQFNTLPDESVPKISAGAVKSDSDQKETPPLPKPKITMQESKYEIIRNKTCKTSKEKKIVSNNKENPEIYKRLSKEVKLEKRVPNSKYQQKFLTSNTFTSDYSNESHPYQYFTERHNSLNSRNSAIKPLINNSRSNKNPDVSKRIKKNKQKSKINGSNQPISQYYCQMTNNINISVDIQKSSYNSSSERNPSVITNSAHQVQQTRKRNLDKKRECNRKIAGKHISIVLNTQNTGDDIDIQISNRKEVVCEDKESKGGKRIETATIVYKKCPLL